MRGLPWVSVPVLSMTSARTAASASIALPPLIRMPSLAARDRPATMATGTARISGQGVATTSTATARIGIGGEPPGAAGERHGDGQEHDGVAVGHARHGRARALRRLDQADDAGIGALVGAGGGGEVEGVADIGRAAHDRFAGALLDGQRFAGQRRLVEHRHALGHRAVDRHHVALAHQQPVAGHDLLERHLLQRVVAVAQRRARHPGKQRGHVAPRPLLGEAFQVLAAGIHQRDDRGGERLARPAAPRSSTARRRCRGRRRRAAGWSRSRPRAPAAPGRWRRSRSRSDQAPSPAKRRHEAGGEAERGEAGEPGPELEAQGFHAVKLPCPAARGPCARSKSPGDAGTSGLVMGLIQGPVSRTLRPGIKRGLGKIAPNRVRNPRRSNQSRSRRQPAAEPAADACSTGGASRRAGGAAAAAAASSGCMW